MDDLREDLALAAAAAKAGGALAAEHFGKSVKTWDKGDATPVCEIDIAVNDLIEQHLRPARPGYGWLSEETKDNAQRLSAKRLWVVDPIDGTRAYLSGKPEYSISIACVEDGRPIAAALYDPSADQLFTAIAGQGAQCNAQPLQVSDWQDALTAHLILDKTMAEHDYWPQPWQPRSLVRPNSMALRLAWVATGKHDLTMALSAKQDWDIAAADLILSEAGGRLTNEQGSGLTYNAPEPTHPFIVGAAPGVHAAACAQMRGLIATYRAKHPAEGD